MLGPSLHIKKILEYPHPLGSRLPKMKEHVNRLPHPGSGKDRTIASVRQVTAFAMLYIGRSVTCGIDYSFAS